MVIFDILFYYYYQILKSLGNRDTPAYSAMLVMWVLFIMLTSAAFMTINGELYTKVASDTAIYFTVFLLLTALTYYFMGHKRYKKIVDKYNELGYNKKTIGYLVALICYFGSMVWALYAAGVWSK